MRDYRSLVARYARFAAIGATIGTMVTLSAAVMEAAQGGSDALPRIRSYVPAGFSTGLIAGIIQFLCRDLYPSGQLWYSLSWALPVMAAVVAGMLVSDPFGFSGSDVLLGASFGFVAGGALGLNFYSTQKPDSDTPPA